MEPKTKVRWVDEKRVYVETPQGDDFIVGFQNESLYQCQRQTKWFQVDKFLASLFDKYLSQEMKEPEHAEDDDVEENEGVIGME